jgi:hypothetical protein
MAKLLLDENLKSGAKQIARKNWAEKLFFQIKLLLWKRYVESTKTKTDLIKVAVPAIFIYSLILLFYNVFTGLFSPDGLEPFLVPFAFWIFVQRIVVQIMSEKSSRLQESMRMMGLSDVAYWLSYFISEGVILGFSLSFLCTFISNAGGGLYNNANFGVVLGLLFSFCLSAVPFSFFLCSFFDTPQTSGQVTLALLLGKTFFFTFFNFDLSKPISIFRLLRGVCSSVRSGHILGVSGVGAGGELPHPPAGPSDREWGLPQLLRQQRGHQCLHYLGDHGHRTLRFIFR